MVYVLGLHLALRGRDEHQNLRHFPSQLSVKSYDGRRYLEYTEDVRLLVEDYTVPVRNRRHKHLNCLNVLRDIQFDRTTCVMCIVHLIGRMVLFIYVH